MEIIIRIILLLFLLAVMVMCTNNDKESVSINKRYHLDIICFLDIVIIAIPIPLSSTNTLYLLLGNGLLFIFDYIIGVTIWSFRYKKINDAIRYGIMENNYYSFKQKRVKYIVRKNTCVRPWANDLDDGYRNIKYTMLQMYNNETQEFVCNLSEEELWEMIKIRKDKGFKRKYQYYQIMYPYNDQKKK